jgi:hypothetical protein
VGYEGTTIEEFETTAAEFFRTAQHPLRKRPYSECVYKPMVELLRYLEANGFTNYIASGGGRDFMRTVTQELYSIPPECIIGSTVALAYRDDGDIGNVVHTATLDIFDDGPASPSGSGAASAGGQSLPREIPTAILPCCTFANIRRGRL